MSTIRIQIAGQWYQWDDNKARKNLKKHGVMFEDAALVFEDEGRIERRDNKHSVNIGKTCRR